MKKVGRLVTDRTIICSSERTSHDD